MASAAATSRLQTTSASQATRAALAGAEPRATRLAGAFAVSLACHVVALVAAHGWRLESRPAPPLVVTMIERGGSGEADGAAGAGPSAAPAAVPAPPAVANVAPVPPPRRPVPRVPTRPNPAALARVPDLATAAPVPVAAVSASAHGVDAALAVDADALAAVGAGAGHGSGDGAGLENARGGAAGGAGGDGLRAFCARCPTPAYPGRARRQGWQGTVDVELVIGRGGAVEEARIGRSSGYPTLDDVALAVARDSTFTVPTDERGLRGELRYRFVLDAAAGER